MAGQLWAVASTGGYMYSLELSDILRTGVWPLCKFRQFCDAGDFTDKGLHKGQIFTWNVYNTVASAGTTLTETTTMAVTNFTIAQGTGTVFEMGNSVPYTGMLDNMSKHPVQEIINKALKKDCVQALDGQAWYQFWSTPLVVAPTAASGQVGTNTSAVLLQTAGTTTMTNSVAMSNNHIKTISDLMKERNIPAYAGDDYFGLAWPSTWRPVKNTLEGIYQYVTEGFGLIYKGEIGRYDNVRFIEQTNIPKGNYSSGNYVSAASFTAWTNGLSDTAFFFGADTVAEAVVVAEEMRGQIPADYGRQKGIAWYYLGGFALTQTQASQARIVRWGSAA
jgi:N4-gp56 family major capsid protein